MPRIRTIKPEFWDSPSTRRASAIARLTFIAMWNWADDAGRGTANVKELEGFIFPNDDVADLSGGKCRSFRHALAEVADCFGVVFYEVSGRPYYSIPSWADHQRNERTANGKHPGPEHADSGLTSGSTPSGGTSDNLRHDAAELPTTSGPGTGEQGNRGTEEVGTEEQRNSARGAAAPPALDLVPSGPSFDDFWATYPRRIDKPAARKAWAKAIKTTNPAEIIAGAAKHREDPNREDAYTKHPATWLNAEAWNNEALPARTTGRESSLARRDRQVQTTLAELAAMENNGQGAITA